MQKAATDPWVDPLFEHRVRETAYFPWEHAGRPDGQEQRYRVEALGLCLREMHTDGMLEKQADALARGRS